MNCHDAFDRFFEFLFGYFDSSFPLKIRPNKKARINASKTLKPQPSSGGLVVVDWYTPQVKKLRVLVVTLNDRYKNAKGVVDRDRFYVQYMHAKRMYRQMLSSAKEASNEKFISEAHKSL